MYPGNLASSSAVLKLACELALISLQPDIQTSSDLSVEPQLTMRALLTSQIKQEGRVCDRSPTFEEALLEIRTLSRPSRADISCSSIHQLLNSLEERLASLSHIH
ncbi:hypothetical protein KOW79_009566 [Hemibagrus wyckioides]|uniref:Uncharacterized protein n=1 Tax=Hemibagrus wyckioides TaxID=337641 RepID=A0A9D3SJN6_9TELE|nr:hypothetical protein KOW79_009566 [Hemibagrus wyckioides]